MTYRLILQASVQVTCGTLKAILEEPWLGCRKVRAAAWSSKQGRLINPRQTAVRQP